MKQYYMLPIGVMDRVTGLAIDPRNPLDDVAWEKYQRWVVVDRNIPDPPLTVVVETTVDEYLAQANALCNEKMTADIAFEDHDYQADSESVALISARVAAIGAGIPLPAGFTWRSSANDDVVMVDATMVNLLAAINARATALREHCVILKSNLVAAEDPSLIDLYSGWPA